MEILLSDFIRENLNSGKNSKKRFFASRDKYRVWKYSFEEIYCTSVKFAGYLYANGIRSGDKIILKGSNSPEWVISFISILFCGAVAVPLDLKSSAEFDAKIEDAVNARAVIAENFELVSHFRHKKMLRFYFSAVTDISEKFPVKIDENSEKISDFLKDYGNIYDNDKWNFIKEVRPDPDRLAEIIFTSGTTSEPKGVMITCKNIEANLKAVISVMDRYAGIFKYMINPKILSMVPLSHMYGQLIGIFTPLMLGASVIFTRVLNPHLVLEIIKEEKIWILGTLPKMLEMIKQAIQEKFNLNTLAFNRKYERMKKSRWQRRLLGFFALHIKTGWRLVAIMVGGAVLDVSVEEFFRTISYSVFQGYGLTETSPLVTLSDPIGSRAGSIGKVLPGQEIKIIGGEVYVRGGNISAGYFNDPERTRKNFKSGWFKTGDIAEIDESGNLYFKGRKDDAVIRPDGLNIFPSDIESVLKLSEEVKDCCVVAVKKENRTILIAALILKENVKTGPGEVVEAANRKLNVYQKLSGYVIWPEPDFPRTPTLKVRKNIVSEYILKKGFSEHKETGSSGTGASSAIKEILRKFHKPGASKLGPGSSLEKDAGLDSIELIELASEIEEKYNVSLDDQLISGATTIEQLEKMVAGSKKTVSKMPFFNVPFYAVSAVIRTAFQFFLMPFISVLYIKKVKGRQNIEKLRDLKGPVVFAANHSSNLDALIILFSLPVKIRRSVAALMSIEHHFRHYFYRSGPLILRILEALGFYLLAVLAVNVIPLSRTHGFKQVLENAGKVVDMGYSLLIFPEGGVTGDGSIKKFENGIGIIASDMRLPVVPVKIGGLYNILRNGILPWGHVPRLPVVKITFGEILLFSKKNYEQITNELEEIIKNRL